MQQPSDEAIEDLAVRTRAAHVATVRAALRGEPEPRGAVPNASPLRAAYPKARAADPVLAVLLADTLAFDALRGPTRTHEAAWARDPIALAGEGPIAPRSLPSVLAFEPNVHRREALERTANERARDTLRAAQPSVDALRALGPALGLESPVGLLGALGLGDAAHAERVASAVLGATDEAYRELEAWIRPRVGLARAGEVTWADRLRTLAAVSTTELVPAGDRSGIASRWIARVGLESALGKIRDDSSPAAINGAGLVTLVERPGERAVVAGTPAAGGRGAAQMVAAVTEALALVLPNEARMASRFGVDRVHHAVAAVVGRRLMLEPGFVTREATVDRARREPVLLEALYAELFAVRMDAALARFAAEVLARGPDLPGRMREYVARAVGSAPAPAWAAHVAARTLELRAGARALAALVEPRVRDVLRERHDEDWFRNPRAGETLAATLGTLRARGAVAYCGDDANAALDPAPLARRVRETLEAARR